MSEQVDILPRHQYDAFLRQLPKDWEQKEIKQIGAVIGGSTPSRDVPSFWRGSIPWVTPGEVSGEGAKLLHDTNDHISASGLAGSGANLLPAGSLLVTTRATLGARVINAVPMTTNQGFKSVVFKKSEEASYYFHLFEKVKPELVRRASGTTFLEISGAEFGSIKVPSPSPNEKLKIAQILDTFDTAIHETEAIIAKLNTVKQGLLHDLLTRGIDANGELRQPQTEAPHLYKESPIGWVPNAWEIKSVKELGEVVTGSTPPSHAPESWGPGFPFITPGDITEDGVTTYTERSVSAKGSRYVRLLPSGSSLVVCIGSTIGKVGITATSSCSNQQINAVIPNEGIDSNFLFYALKLHIGQLRRLAGLQAVPIVNKSSFESICLPAPHKNEQIAISNRILALSNTLKNESLLVEKLIQQKNGLMDDLLTGRVRVKQLLTDATQQTGGD
jgi:type I restriction enzyme S subunit